jgi:hypothetical protein
MDGVLHTLWFYNDSLNSMRHAAVHISAQLPYAVPHGILRVFNTILYENEFQSPQMFHPQ